MLPLDILTGEAKAGFEKHGVMEDDITIALELDLDNAGNFGETWLAIDANKRKLYRMTITSDASEAYRKKKMQNLELGKGKKTNKGNAIAKVDTEHFAKASFKEFDLDRLSGTYVDNFVSSNRILSKLDQIPEPTGEEAGKETPAEKQKRLNSGETITIAFCSNAKKRRLFTFIDIMKRITRKENVAEDDPIFDQYNAKCPKCGKRYEDQNKRICKDCTNQKAVIFRIFRYFNGLKLRFVIIMSCLIISSALGLITPLISNLLFIDNVLNVNGKLHDIKYVYVFVAYTFGLAIFSLLMAMLQGWANYTMATKFVMRMKVDVFTAMQKMSLSFFTINPTGALITRCNSDADAIRTFFNQMIPQVVMNSLTLVGLAILLFMLNWKLTLIVFIPIPLIILILKKRLPALYRLYTLSYRKNSSRNAVLSDSLTGVRVVKAFAKESEETNRFHSKNESCSKIALDLNKFSLTVYPLIGLLIGMTSNAIWGYGGINVMNETMTYGEFSTYLSYLGMIFGPINFFTSFTDSITNTINCAQRLFEVIDSTPELMDDPEAVHIERFDGDIEFKKVCFHYAPNRPILKDVTLKIKAGEHIGLVGHTGAGKTTIANLVNRLYDVISGSIEIDGVNVKKIAGKSMRKNIAIVSQEIYLFRGTIAENIRYGKPDATMDEIIAAAKAANAHDFITSMPHGYDSLVGTGNGSLSGGQNQRISIARALLLDPSILILDEATAAMDTETERLIQNAINELIVGRTTITIAHRLSTLKDSDYLYVIDHGEVKERGTHEELLDMKGTFYRLYTLQNEANKKILQGM